MRKPVADAWRLVCRRPGNYVRNMSMQGLSYLLASIMAAGDVAALDARDPRLAHLALVELDRFQIPAALSLLQRFGVEVRTTPDPEVGLRVSGLTQATWDAVADGLLEPLEDGHRVWFVLSGRERARLWRQVRHLPIGEAECLYRVGAAWALASTDRKNRANEGASASMRHFSLA